MAVTRGLVDLEFNTFEYCFLLEDTSVGASYFKMNVPVMMPLIPHGEPKAVSGGLNGNIFVNDPAIKPKVPTTISTQNFITIKRFENTEFKHKEGPPGIIKKGARFLAAIIDNNPRDIHITDNL